MDYKKYFEENIEQFKLGSNNQATGLCPFHDDHNPSFSCNIETGLWKCFGCGESGNFAAFMRKVGYEGYEQNDFIAYTYCNADGQECCQVRRYANKKFLAFHLEEGDWVKGWAGPKMLYNLPCIKNEETVFVVEGEKDVDSLSNIEIPATTSPFGAGKWQDDYSADLKDKIVIIIPDQDSIGQKHAQQVAESVVKTAQKVLILNLPKSKDVTEWLENHGGDVDQLLELCASPEFVTEYKATDITLTELKNLTRTQKQWPVMREEAYHGLAGKIVSAIDPFTEADKNAVLLNLLTIFGNVVGNKPHFKVEHTQHPLKIYTCVVGESSKGRKGTSVSTILKLFTLADPTWSDKVVRSALSSGEGLIQNLKDNDEDIKKDSVAEPNLDNNAENKSDSNVDGRPSFSRAKQFLNDLIQTSEEDDRRILLYEEEFAVPLKKMNSENNTLSGILRQAWDSKTLKIMTRTNPVTASNTHVSLIAHVTISDLLRYLNQNDMANGFGNRFIWIMAKRSKIIPSPKGIPESDLANFAHELKQIISEVKQFDEIHRSAEAEKLWTEKYELLSCERYGLTGSLLNRAEAQTMRLACIYALLDRKNQVEADHLKAAFAVWSYCEDSTHYIFGNKTGHPVADQILDALQAKTELSKEDINKLFSNNKSSYERSHAVEYLLNMRLITGEVIKETGGSPKTIYKLAVSKTGNLFD